PVPAAMSAATHTVVLKLRRSIWTLPRILSRGAWHAAKTASIATRITPRSKALALLQRVQQVHVAQDVEDARRRLIRKLRLVEADGDFGEVDIHDAADGAVEGFHLRVLARGGAVNFLEQAAVLGLGAEDAVEGVRERAEFVLDRLFLRGRKRT